MVHGSRKDQFSAQLTIRQHELVSGLSAKIGGKDEGPDPHELIEAALTACTILTCQMYAARKQWLLTSTRVSVHIESEDNVAGTVMIRTIQFEGELSEEQRARLLEIANKCPIHRLLVGKIEIKTELTGK